MSRRDFADDSCTGCGASLDKALHYDKKNVVYEAGEYVGEGVDVIAFCGCGASTTIVFSVSPRAVAT